MEVSDSNRMYGDIKEYGNLHQILTWMNGNSRKEKTATLFFRAIKFQSPY
jgi:hypothetical protein